MIPLAQITASILVGFAMFTAVAAPSGWTEDQLQVVIYGAIIGGLVLLLNTANAFLQILRHFRPSPPIHQHYATKSELAELRKETKEQLKAVTENNEKNFREVFESLRTIERSLGRLEGSINKD